MTLLECFERHGCDRGRQHGYDRVYSQLPPPARMLEIGIWKGAGIAAWLDYWPQVHITGLDTFQRLPANQIAILRHPRVSWHQGDSRTFRLPGPFDLIIDDGDHRVDAQRETFDNFHTALAPGGAYFIEDVRPGQPGYENLLDALEGYRVTHHDLRKGRAADSYLLEIRC